MTSLAGSRLEGWTPEPAATVAQCVDQLLRDSAGTLGRIARGEQLGVLARAMILSIAMGGGLFGAAMGAFRGDEQVLYAALKLPLAMLLTTAVCAPALTSLNAALGRPARLRQDLSLVLSALARASLVLAAEAPIVLLAVRLGVGYHSLTLLAVGCCVVAGGVGLVLFVQGLTGRSGATAVDRGDAQARQGVGTVAVALLMVFALVGSQMAWTLRPYLLRPRTPDIPLVRSIEGSFLAAVLVSSRSARGIYRRDAAPLPEDEP